MAKHTLEKYKTLIANMSVSQHAVTVKREVWKKKCERDGIPADLIHPLFGNQESIDIARGDLFELSKGDNTQKFILETVLWAYPGGGRGKNVKKLLEALDRLQALLDEIREEGAIHNWQEHFKRVDEIPGVRISTYSKFVYFMHTSIEGRPALILDGRLIDALNKGTFDEFSSLREIGYNNAHREYLSYLDIMHQVAHHLGVDAEKLEMFLFFFGTSLKPENG